jgi:hypothetical protein
MIDGQEFNGLYGTHWGACADVVRIREGAMKGDMTRVVEGIDERVKSQFEEVRKNIDGMLALGVAECIPTPEPLLKLACVGEGDKELSVMPETGGILMVSIEKEWDYAEVALDKRSALKLAAAIADHYSEPAEKSRAEPSQSVAESLTMLDFALSFALCNMHHDGTRRDVKKAMRELDRLRELVEGLTEGKP